MIITTTSPGFERSSKRRKGFPSETHVKRGMRSVRGGEVELLEKLGRNDPVSGKQRPTLFRPCRGHGRPDAPCGSGRRFQGVLPG